jgi:hypothetical protein
MPNRIVREGILASERVSKMSFGAQLFYHNLMLVVDDFGRFENKAELLRARCFPLQLDRVTSSDILGWLLECSNGDNPLITTYQDEDHKLLQVNNFGQRIRPNTKSKYPEPMPFRGQTPRSAAESGETPPKPAYARASPTPPTTNTPSATSTPPATEAQTWGWNGWSDGTDFENWWREFAGRHPNPKSSGLARGELAHKVLAGKVTRGDFESGYARHAASWDAGFEPNLFEFVHDEHWRLPERKRKANGATDQHQKNIQKLKELGYAD